METHKNIRPKQTEKASLSKRNKVKVYKSSGEEN